MKGKSSTNARRCAKSDATMKTRRTPRPTPPAGSTMATSTTTTTTGGSSIHDEATTSIDNNNDSVISPPLSMASQQTNPDAAEKHEARRIARRVKTSLASEEGTSSSINHQDDQTIDTILFTPGAYSVPGDKLLESPPPPNALENFKTDEEQATFAEPMHSPDSLLVAAELVQPVEDEPIKNMNDEEWKRQIEQEVASRLVQRDQCLTVAEVVIDSDIKADDDQVQCRQCLWRWKFLLLFLFLCVGGGLVAIILWATGSFEPDSPTMAPTPSPTLDHRQQRIFDTLQNYTTDLTSTYNTDPNSPQSLALDWLLFNDTYSALRNFKIDGSGLRTMILQRYALAVLFFSTNGPLWKNRLSFLTDRPVCEWNDNEDASQLNNDSWNASSSNPLLLNATYGIYCNSSSSTMQQEDVVQQIRLSHNDLVGTIPSELGLLSNLQVLWLDNNTLDHDLPTELGMLTALEELILATNLLDGTLPTEYGQCTALTNLQLSTNNLVGMIPTELGQLTVLQRLDVHDNRFTGTLPLEMGNWSALEQLDLYRNYMRGTVPTELGLLSALTSLRAQSNDFIGTLPTELGQLTHLQELYIYDNSLSGTIPTELLDSSNSSNFTAQVIFDPQNLGIGGGVGMGSLSPTGTSAPTDAGKSAAAAATTFALGGGWTCHCWLSCFLSIIPWVPYTLLVLALVQF